MVVLYRGAYRMYLYVLLYLLFHCISMLSIDTISILRSSWMTCSMYEWLYFYDVYPDFPVYTVFRLSSVYCLLSRQDPRTISPFTANQSPFLWSYPDINLACVMQAPRAFNQNNSRGALISPLFWDLVKSAINMIHTIIWVITVARDMKFVCLKQHFSKKTVFPQFSIFWVFYSLISYSARTQHLIYV